MSVTLPDDELLQLKEPAHPLRLYPAYGGAQLKLRVDISSNKASNNQLSVTAVLHAGPATSHDLPELCRLSAESLITPHQQGSDYTLSAFVSDAALADLVETCQGNTVKLELRSLQVYLVHGTPPRLTSAQSGSSLTMTIPAGTFAEELEKVTASSFLDILVPITSDKELAAAAGHLRTAREYLWEGKVKAMPAEIRQALDALCKAYYGPQAERDEARKKNARLRSVHERWVLLIENAYSMLSAFIHEDDAAIEGAEIDRPLAVAMLAQVAGMLARLAADRHAGRI